MPAIYTVFLMIPKAALFHVTPFVSHQRSSRKICTVFFCQEPSTGDQKRLSDALTTDTSDVGVISPCHQRNYPIIMLT